MSTISQSIPNLLSGISQQPDSRKRPGQLKDSVNAFPDFALGLLKRPGGKFVANLPGATSGGKWFPILRDQTEKYVVQYADNRFHVWDLADGDVRAVDMGAAQGPTAGTCLIADQLTAATDYNDKVALRVAALATLQTAEKNLALATAAQFETVERLFQFTYTYDEKVIESLHSGVAQDVEGNLIVKENGAIISSATSMPNNYILGTERTLEHPLVASLGFRIYEAEKVIAATNTPALAGAQTDYTNALNAYNAADADVVTAKTTLDTQRSNCAIATIAPTAYLAGANPEDIEVLTLNDFTFVLNKKKVVALNTTTTTHSGGLLDAHRAHVVINVVAFSSLYKINLDGTDYNYTSSSTDNADAIAVGLASAVNGGSQNFVATAVGPGVYITRTSAFSIEVSGGSSAESIFAITDTVANIGRLPAQTKNGYVAEIVNSSELDVDNMHVVFTTDNNQNFGTGQWTETTEPGINFELDASTMPHQLVRQANGTFTFSEVDWNDRIVGNDDTNPAPSFVGHEITSIFFYRNRLGFLAGQNVVLGRADDIFNFWNTSAQAAVNDDPIDISCAGKKPVFLNYVEPTAVGLVLYSTSEQFLLTTDSDILSPTTAKINTLSSYETDASIDSVSLGTTQAFVSKTPLYTRLFELNDITSDQPPLMADQTATIPELIPASINSMVASPALSIVSMGTVGSSDIYQYRFLTKTREERLVNSWYRWQLTGTLLTQFFDSSTLYAVVANGSDVYVQSFDMTQSSEQGFLTLPTGEKTDVCLDLFVTNPLRTYSAADNKTSVFLPYDNVGDKNLSVVVLGDYGTVMTIDSTDITGAAGAKFVEIPGDYRGVDMVVGHDYVMTVDLPKLYRYKINNNQITNDDVSSLIIHRIKVKTGLSGPVDYRVSITGFEDWTNTILVTQPNQYQLNNVNMQASSTHVVPIFQRNENLAIRIIGNTPFPVSLLGLDWEGKLNQRFYRRG